MKQKLLSLYKELCVLCDIESGENDSNIYILIRNMLEEFCNSCNNPAIWCNGKHTEMLMADFVYELRDIKIVIDDNAYSTEECGYKMISSAEIDENGVDGVVISSYRYKNEIVDKIKKQYPEIRYLDIYAELLKHGIHCNGEYYLSNHPYEKYKRINEKIYQTGLCEKDDLSGLIYMLVGIKDFRLAKHYAEIYCSKYIEDSRMNKILELINVLISHIKVAVQDINPKSVLMLCIDSLREEDLDNGLVPKIKSLIDGKMTYYSRAYSVSTSTQESLIPAYSENFDLRTKYYEKNVISRNDCRFINKALSQDRKIYFYTDAEQFIDNEEIIHRGVSQTVTEKIWDFIIDSSDEVKGLYYIHVLYESHFSFVNPYTKTELYAAGTNLFFDLLKKNGGRLRADYVQQHKDALRYLDDTLFDYLDNLNIPMIIYADHGISIYPKETRLENIKPISLAFDNSKIKIPFAYYNGTNVSITSDELFSLADINEVLISLMDEKEYLHKKRDYVKIQRSHIYNPDYIFLYKYFDFLKGASAFEAFVFDTEEKLVIYEDGQTDLYDKSDLEMSDEDRKKELYSKIQDDITVCPRENVWINKT